MNQIIVSDQKLRKLCIARLEKAGICPEHAAIVADVLVHANLKGIDSHGVMRLEHYLKRIAAGGINPNPVIEVKETGAATAVADGDDCLGHIVAQKAMAGAIELARKSGAGLVGAINSSHCGALSYYVKQAVDEKMIGMAMSHTDKAVVPFCGARPFFGTNPLAFGFPAGEEQAVILDMATSTVAYGKIMQAQEKCEPIPAGWAVDQKGKEITDPSQYFALLPFGGPKGYGLAMVVDILSGILTGSAFGPHVNLMYGDYDRKRKLGHFFMAINVSMFTEEELFLKKMDQMIREIHATPPAEGFDRVMAPGEPESVTERERLKYGIPLDRAVYDFLVG